MQQIIRPELYQVTWIILEAVKHLRVGKIKLAQFLKGSKSKEIKPLTDTVIYGGLLWYNISTIIKFIEQLEEMNLIQRKTMRGYHFDYPILELTDTGRLVLEEKKHFPLQIIKEVKPITVGDSEMQTYDLFRQGKDIACIARERNLSTSTIYTHLFRLIATGHLSSAAVVSQEVIDVITAVAQKFTKPTVKEIKELLPAISYDEIRCVLVDFMGVKE